MDGSMWAREVVMGPDPERPGKKRIRYESGTDAETVPVGRYLSRAVAERTRVMLVDCDHQRVGPVVALSDGLGLGDSAWEPSLFDSRFERCALCGAARYSAAAREALEPLWAQRRQRQVREEKRRLEDALRAEREAAERQIEAEQIEAEQPAEKRKRRRMVDRYRVAVRAFGKWAYPWEFATLAEARAQAKTVRASHAYDVVKVWSVTVEREG